MRPGSALTHLTSAPQSSVSMVRIGSAGSGRDRFVCSEADWTLLLQVAESFGWKPRGTTYTPTRVANPTDPGLRHDYRPGDERDKKQVAVEDAIAWAVALSEAQRSPHLAAMLDATAEGTAFSAAAAAGAMPIENPPFAAVMERFIEYAFGGAFSFARSAST